MSRRWITSLGLITSVLAAARSSAAQPDPRLTPPDAAAPAVSERPRPAVVGRPALEWAVAAIGGAVWLSTGALFKSHIAPSECRWCESNGFDEELRSLRWSDARAADLTSDVLSYGLAPVAAGGLLTLAALQEGRASELSLDLVIVSEALVASGLAGEVLRFATARERPSVHQLPPAEKPMTEHPEENNLSFVSGHSATSFGLAVASGAVASLRRRRLAPLIWATGLTLAATTTYLRVAADEHYATDALVGAVLGAGVGLVIPLLHRPRTGREQLGAALAPAPGGAMLVLFWR